MADRVEKLEAALLELRAQTLCRLAHILKIQAGLDDIRELVGRLSDRNVLERLALQQGRSSAEEKSPHWWSAALNWLRGRS